MGQNRKPFRSLQKELRSLRGNFFVCWIYCRLLRFLPKLLKEQK
uniref:Uncharacterized protein n=1 Tax=Anguilla anguilla TaxID=7936 RepID=A0A0E9P5V9_ANGAN